MWLRFDSSEVRDGSPLAVPVHYEMKGYNTLLGSHYDHYYVTYHDYRAEVLDQSHVFDIFLKKDCHGWPGPGMDHTYNMNPMEEFKEKHKRNFETEEHERRLTLFRQNMRFIHSKNRAGLTYRLESNHLAD